MIIGRRDGDRAISLTVTAATTRPYVLTFQVGDVPSDLAGSIDGVVGSNWVDDVYGAADWRRHITVLLASQVLEELQ